MPEILIIGGPNGAGKTTAARFLFQEQMATREFVNADEIARGLSPYDPDSAAIAAGRVMLGSYERTRKAAREFRR